MGTGLAGREARGLAATGSATDDLLDSVALYLRDAGDSRGLPADEERALGKAIAEGRDAEARLAADDYAPDGVEALQVAAEAGQHARQRLTESNLRLVLHVASRFRTAGLALGDLVQEGNIGLMQAVDRFDYARGFRFSTYAVWWIRQAIQRALSNTSRTIRMPVHAVQNAWKAEETHARLEQELGRAPTVEEVAASLDRPVAEVRHLARYLNITSAIAAP